MWSEHWFSYMKNVAECKMNGRWWKDQPARLNWHGFVFSSLGLRDSSGIRFYLGNRLRKYDLGYLLFGTLSSPKSLSIPPKYDQFIVDSYCPGEATRVCRSFNIWVDCGIVFCEAVSAQFWNQCCICFATHSSSRYAPATRIIQFKHRHFRIGFSVSTKLLRNNTAVQYLFNAEAYDFNYQFANRLPEPIKIYPVRREIVKIGDIEVKFRAMPLLLGVCTVQRTRTRWHW